MLTIQTLVIASVILALYRARPAIGMAPLYVLLGVLQVLQTLTSTVVIEVAPGFLVSPGSTILFTLSLCTLLLVYINIGANEARRLILAIVIANLAAGLLLISFDYQIRGGAARSLLDMPPAVFILTADALIIGTLLLIVDVIFTPILYELSARCTRLLFVRMLVTVVVVLAVDGVLYVMVVFSTHPDIVDILLTTVIAKAVVAAAFCTLAVLYLRVIEHKSAVPAPRDVFAILTDRSSEPHGIAK